MISWQYEILSNIFRKTFSLLSIIQIIKFYGFCYSLIKLESGSQAFIYLLFFKWILKIKKLNLFTVIPS